MTLLFLRRSFVDETKKKYKKLEEKVQIEKGEHIKNTDDQLKLLLAGMSLNNDNPLDQDDKWKKTKFYQVCLILCLHVLYSQSF